MKKLKPLWINGLKFGKGPTGNINKSIDDLLFNLEINIPKPDSVFRIFSPDHSLFTNYDELLEELKKENAEL